MSLQPSLIIYLVIAALLALALLGFFGVLHGDQRWLAGTIAVIGGGTSITHAKQWRPATAQGTES